MSAFRALALSAQQDEASSSSPAKSTPNQSNSGGNSGASGLPCTGDYPSGGADAGSGSNGGQRKRRTAGSVSQMACTPCRTARQRCDGIRPNACGRCTQRKFECVYEPHTKTHKNDLIKEIEGLRGDNNDLLNRNREIQDVARDSQLRNRDLQQTSDWRRIILKTIGGSGHDREIIRRLRAGESHQAIADWLIRENPNFGALAHESQTHRRLVDVVKMYELQCSGDDGLRRFSPSPSEIPWTGVSTSHKLIGHLFDLYFTWVHPIHMLFSELDFKHDFKSIVNTYCSPSLVNAVCAMGCTLLESEEFSDSSRGRIDAATLRGGFMAEARENQSPDSYHYLTSIQSFGVMYLVELSSGKARSAVGYLRSAVENLQASNGHTQSEEAIQLTLWGFQTLNTSSTSITYQKMHASPAPPDATFKHVRMDKDEDTWRFYRQPGDKQDLPTRSSHVILTACQQAQLFRTIQESLDLYCSPRTKVTAEMFLTIYARYLDWMQNLPPIIRDIDENDQPLPHVLYLHVQYHTALVQHFSPLLHCGFFTGNDQEELRHIIVFHARSGFEIFEHSRRLYSSRFAMPLLSFCLINLCDALVRLSPNAPQAPEVVSFCLEILQQTRAGFPLCKPLQWLFLQTVEECGVHPPPELSDIIDSFSHVVLDDVLDACTRLAYTQPLDQILPHLDPAIAGDFNREWDKQVVNRPKPHRKESSSGRYLQIGNLLNN